MIFIVGGSSLIGYALAAKFSQSSVKYYSSSRSIRSSYVYFDLSSHLDYDLIFPSDVTTVVLCAGLTSFSSCSSDPSLSYNVNVTSIKRLISYLIGRGIYIIFLSSNAVFEASLAFSHEDAPRHPVSIYAYQKCLVENYLISSTYSYYSIIRLGKVISRSTPLISQWSSSLASCKQIKAFSNIYTSPISLDFALEVICRVIFLKPSAAVFNSTASHDISFYFLALHLCNYLNLNFKNVVQSISDQSYIPTCNSLSCSNLSLLDLYSPDPSNCFS
ncbi:MAG: hypothetical protein CL681_02405 [Blastopirellula sp.]|nr:hypothetical protein [Blastopirellula sp.]